MVQPLLKTWGQGEVVVHVDLDNNFQRLNTASFPLFHPGGTVANENVLMISLNYPLTIPANFAGTTFLALTAPQGSPQFRFLTYRNAAWTLLTMLTVGPTGALAAPASSAISLNPGDGFWLQGPPVPDTTLADFSFDFLFVRT